MRLTRISACLLAISFQKVAALNFLQPRPGTVLTAGTSFQVSWQWNSLPNPTDDGTMDILLVTDSTASSVAADLYANVSPLWLFTSVTVPTSVTSGMYYIQLKVTSGTETSAVNGPYSVLSGSANSSISSTSSFPSTTSQAPTNAATNTASNTVKISVPTSNTQTQNTVNSASSHSSSTVLPTGAIAAIAVGGVIFVCGMIGAIFWWRKSNRLLNAMTAKYEKQAQLYGQQAQMKDSQIGHGGPTSPQSAYTGTYNRSHEIANAPGTELYNYSASSNYPVDQQSQAPLHYRPTSLPSSPVSNQPTYPMPMPVPFNRQQESIYHQQTMYGGYINGDTNPAVLHSSRIEVSTVYSAPNTNNTTSLLNGGGPQDPVHNVPHTPDEPIDSPPHFNDTSKPPHSS